MSPTGTMLDPSPSQLSRSNVGGHFPIRFAPILRPLVWGGRKLGTHLGKSLPTSDLYAESWELSPLDEAESQASSPEWLGATLSELWTRYPEWRGPQLQSAAHFPWLIKWLDCQDRLSVQVHPDADTCLRLTGRTQPKTEVWVVVQADPTARVWAGCRPNVTAEEFNRRLHDGTVVDCLYEFIPQPGDCIYLPAGTVHAAGGGLVIAEVQQPSDVTFRLFDWNRLGTDGMTRQLHLDSGLAAMHWPQSPVKPAVPVPHDDATDVVRGERLLSTPEFQLDRWTLTAPWSRSSDEFAVWMVLAGRGHLISGDGTQLVSSGQTLWFPAVPMHVTWQPEAAEPLTLLRITPPAV